MSLLSRRSVLVLVVLLVGAAVGVALLPERYAVNVPLMHALFGRGGANVGEDVVLERLRVARGFSVARFARDVPNVRALRFTPQGDLLASQPRAGRVVLLHADADGDGLADGLTPLLQELNRPHGIDLHAGWLYVAETDAVGRVRFDARRRQVVGPFERVVKGLPAGGNHWTRSLRFGPDGWMYVSIGSTCNVCIEEDRRRATLMRYRPDGSGEEVFATGLRNAVGFDWRPADGKLYATDNGRDLLGDDFPPCELNEVLQGGFYGWPFANGDRIPDPDFGAGQEARVAASRPPVHGFRAHNAPLGIAFVRPAQSPLGYEGAALVALHGSWNRTRKDGYKVVSLHWRPDGSIEEREFLAGFEQDEDVIGRPVDVAQGPDGAFYVSDDYGGSVFRVSVTPDGADAGSGPGLLGSAWAGPAQPQSGTAAGRGQVLYAAHGCARCHEPGAAEAGMRVHPLRELNARWDLDGLATYLAAPTPPMPLVLLSRDEYRGLAAYLLAREPGKAE